MSTVFVFAGGNPPPISILDELPQPDRVIAADSGYLVASALGYGVDALVGDMDSLPEETAITRTTDRLSHPKDKDATDLDLAFELAIRDQPGRIVLVGAEGGRFDHEVAALTTICDDRWASVPEIDWIRSDSICHVIRKTRRIQGDRGGTISLIPFGGTASAVSTRGLKWTLDNDTLYSGTSLGVSNQFDKPEVVISVGKGVVLAIIPSP